MEIPSMFLPRLLVGKRSEGIRSTFSCVLLEESLEEIVPLFLRFFFGGDLVHSLCGLGGESSEEFVPCFERFSGNHCIFFTFCRWNEELIRSMYFALYRGNQTRGVASMISLFDGGGGGVVV